MDRSVKLVADALVDVAAIGGLVWLAYAGKLDALIAAGIMASLAGGQLTARVLQARNGASGVTLRPPPPASLVLVVGGAAWLAHHAARVLAALLVLGTLAGCGGATPPACSYVEHAACAACTAAHAWCEADGGSP